MQLFRGVDRLVYMGSQLYDRVRGIIESARAGAARSVDTAQVVSNWLIGREIVEEEQGGEKRAAYGRRIIERLSERLMAEYGRGYSVQNLQYIRRFSISFPELHGSSQFPNHWLGNSASHHKRRSMQFGHQWWPNLGAPGS